MLRCVKYIRYTAEIPLTLEASKAIVMRWWIDAAYGVQPDTKIQSSRIMLLGKGSMQSKSSKKKMNTQSSTEAEIVGVEDNIYGVIWSMRLLFQDNQSTMITEKNGKYSCGKKMRHTDTR